MKLISLKNSKGQAFSTFQLLIAAVVALALLGVLMPIITNINPGTDRLVDALKERINTQQDQPGTLTLTDEIKVSSKGDPYVSAATITEGTGLADDQVKFMLNGYENDFAVNEGNNVLEVRASSSVTYQFGILCHRNFEELENSIKDYSSIIKETEDLPTFDENNVRVCIVVPVKR